MPNATHAAIAMRAAPQPARGPVARLRSLVQRVAGIWRHAVARNEFNQVDEATLRDLGMCRAEFSSYWAESQGWTEPTRRRVIQTLGRGYRL